MIIDYRRYLVPSLFRRLIYALWSKKGKVALFILANLLVWGFVYYRHQSKIVSMQGVVKRVVDGDTFILTSGERVRLLLIDAPERAQLSTDGESIGLWSMQFLKQKLEGKRVQLEVEGRDIYQRLLARVYLPHGEEVNAMMVKEGYALVYPYATSVDEFYKWQNEARYQKRGIWLSAGFLNPKNHRRNKS